MKVIKILGLSLLVIVLILALLTFILPTSFSVERSVDIEAPKTFVYEHVSKFRNFQEWSPWTPRDPDMEISIDGTDGEIGALYRWKGEVAGEGSQEIIGKTDGRIDIELIFTKPFATKNTTYYTIEENNGSTTVSWGMTGSSPRPYNLMGLFMNMEKMIGKDYEDGLANLKQRVESLYEQKQKTSMIRMVTEFQRSYIAEKGEVAFSEIATFFMSSLNSLTTQLAEAGIEMNGYISSIYYTWNEETERTEMAVAVPVNEVPDDQEIELLLIDGNGIFLEHTGSYEGLKGTYDEMIAYVEEQNKSMEFVAVEEYITSQNTGHPEAEWLTRVYFIWEN